jgi:hypothetical protein
MLPVLNSSVMAMSRGTRAWLVVLTIAVLATPLVYLTRDRLVAAGDSRGAGQMPAAEFLPQLSEREQKIREILAKPGDLSYTQVSLADVVTALQDQFGIEIHLDRVAMEEAGKSGDELITISVKGVSLGSALRLMLRPHDLCVVVRDEVLQLTSKEEAAALLVTRIYPVGDISDQQGFADLVDAITSTIDYATWDEYGGNGSVAPLSGASSLIISQSQDVHDQVLQLLRSLRTARRASGAIAKSTSATTGGKASTSRKSKRTVETKGLGGMGGGMGGGGMVRGAGGKGEAVNRPPDAKAPPGDSTDSQTTPGEPRPPATQENDK